MATRIARPPNAFSSGFSGGACEGNTVSLSPLVLLTAGDAGRQCDRDPGDPEAVPVADASRFLRGMPFSMGARVWATGLLRTISAPVSFPRSFKVLSGHTSEKPLA